MATMHRLRRRVAAVRWVGAALVVVVAALLGAALVVADGEPGGTAGSTGHAKPKKETFRAPFVQRLVEASQFRDEVLLNPKPVVALVYDPKERALVATLAPVFNAAAEELHGLCAFMAISAATEVGSSMISGFGVGQLPAIILLNTDLVAVEQQPGAVSRAPIGFHGESTREALLRWVVENLSATAIERIADAHDLANFFLKHPSLPTLPHVVYFTDAATVAPLYKVLSQQYRYGASFGVVVNATAHSAALMEMYDVTKLPAMLVFLRSDAEHDEVLHLSPIHESSTITDIEALLQPYLLSKDEQEGARPYILQQEAIDRRRALERPKVVEPPVVVTDHSQWTTHCLRVPRSHHCIAVFVDSVAQANEKLPMLHAVAKRLAGKSSSTVHIVVLDGGANYEIMSYFDASHGTPDIVFLNPGTKTYMNFVGSFTESGIANFFLTRAAVGQGKKYIPKQVPRLIPRTDARTDDHHDL